MSNENPLDQQNIADSEFDTKGLLLDFLSHWKWFAISVAACLVLAFIYIKSVIPTYQVEASIYLNDAAQANGNAFSMTAADPMLAFKDYIDETELEVMKSRNNLVKIVDSLGLSYTYYYKGSLRDTPLYGNNPIAATLDTLSLYNLKSPIFVEVSPKDGDKYDIKVSTEFKEIKEKKEVKETTLPCEIQLSHGTLTLTRSSLIPEVEHSEKIVITSPRATATALSKRLNIEFAKNSEKIIRLSLLDEVPQRGFDIIEALLAFYNQDIIEDKNRSALQTEAFILERLVMINDELKNVENRLQTYRQQHNISDLQAQSHLNLSQQSNYNAQLAEVEAELILFDDIEKMIQSSESHQTLPTLVNEPGLTTIIETYNRKVNQFNRTIEGSTPDNPLVVSMIGELNTDRARIMQSIQAARRNLLAMRSNIEKLDRAAGAELASQPSVDKGLQEILRDQQVKVNIYTFLLQRREDIALQKTIATSTARLIDDPIADAPVAPRKMLIMAAAFLIGLLIPGAFIFLRRSLFPTFGNQEELKRLTNVPVIGELCRASKGSESTIVVAENVATPVAELFRLLRNNISFTRKGAESRVILVTSAVSGEGKTFVASNLAMTYALMKKKVLVIGMDLRRPVLPTVFGIKNNMGVSTYLAGKETDLAKLVVQSHQDPNLYALPAGPVPPNPNELLMGERMKELIAKARIEFDYVIIDSAPVGLVSDSFLISRLTDLQIFVVRAGKSTRNALQLLHEAVAANKFSAAYLVINDVDMASGVYSYQRYGYYSSSKKTYGYGYGYGQHDRK